MTFNFYMDIQRRILMEEFTINFGNLKVDQLAFVYKDIEKQAKVMETILGIPKFTFMPAVDHTAYYRGKETHYVSKMAFSRYLSVQLELIQLLEGECVYGEFLNENREGFHHIAVIVDDAQP